MRSRRLGTACAAAVLGVAGAMPAWAWQEIMPGWIAPEPVQAQAEEVVIDGPQGDPSEQPTQVQPQVQQILSNVRAGKSRDTAEDKLVRLGANAMGVLKGQLASQKGAARDAVAVALFRLENAPLAPEGLLTQWASRQADSDPSNFTLQRIETNELWKQFPHHLFYAVSLKSGATAKAGFERTVVALAADGKVQAIGDDPGLARFLKHELLLKTGDKERRRAAGAAATLALARQISVGEVVGTDVLADGKVSEGGLSGTASIRGKGRAVTVVLQVDGEGRINSMSTTQAEEPGRGGNTTEPATPTTASTAPATRARPRLPKPQIRGGPEPLDPPGDR